MCSSFPFLFSFTGFSFVQDLDAIRHELEGEIAYGLDYGLKEPTDADVFEALEADDEEEASEELPPDVRDIPGLKVNPDHSLSFNGEKVVSITSMDGDEEGEQVFNDEEAELEAEEADDEDFDDSLSGIRSVTPLKSVKAVKKLLPLKSVTGIKSLQPIKSIDEIVNMEEVKRILPIPDDIAREFIARHGLKSGGSISGGSAFESELPSGGISQAGQGISDFMPPKPIMRLQNVLEILDTAARSIEKAQAYITVALRENDGFDVISKGEADDDFESEEVSEESEGVHLGSHGKVKNHTL